MKKKFLKVFSIVMCFISVFSDCNLYALKIYTIEFNSSNNIGTLKIENIEENDEGKDTFCIKKHINENEIFTKYYSFRRDAKVNEKIKKNIQEIERYIEKLEPPESVQFEISDFMRKSLNKKTDDNPSDRSISGNHTYDKNIFDELCRCLKPPKIPHRILGARGRQEDRKEGKKDYRYLSQQITASIPEPYKLFTPFGEVELEFHHGEGGKNYDVLIVIDGKGITYDSIGKTIDDFVNTNELRKELAGIIDKYLRTSKLDDIDLNFPNILSELNKIYSEKQSVFFEKSYFNKYENIKSAKNAAAALSAILFISEPGPNRAGDGGKSARASLKFIINEQKTFKDVFFCSPNGNMPLYSPAVYGGASAIRTLSQKGSIFEIGDIKSKKKINSVNLKLDQCSQFEKTLYKLEGYMSDDSDVEEEIEIKKEPEETRTKLQNKFNEWINTANSEQIEEFEKKFEEFLKKQSVKTEN